jgi:hypothetical protein
MGCSKNDLAIIVPITAKQSDRQVSIGAQSGPAVNAVKTVSSSGKGGLVCGDVSALIGRTLADSPGRFN